jgi:hypothetical protein
LLLHLSPSPFLFFLLLDRVLLCNSLPWTQTPPTSVFKC